MFFNQSTAQFDPNGSCAASGGPARDAERSNSVYQKRDSASFEAIDTLCREQGRTALAETELERLIRVEILGRA